MSATQSERGAADYSAEENAYLDVQSTPEFQELRRRYRGWVLPVTAAALAWYFLYVGLAAYAPGFMGQKVFGNINIGLLAGLGQFVSTFAVTGLYIRYANRVLDPVSDQIRADFARDHR